MQPGDPSPHGSQPSSPPPYQPSSPPPPYQPPPPGPPGAPRPNNTLGLMALIAGVAGVLMSTFGLAAAILVTQAVAAVPGVAGACCLLLAVVAGGAGIVLGIIGRRRASRGLATNGGAALAGIITGAIAVVLFLAVLAVIGVLIYLETT